MMRRLARTCALAAAALLLSACTVLDTRHEIRIEPEGTLHADGLVALTVRGRFDRFRVAVDGETVEGEYPAGQRVKVPVHGIDPGRHTLEVRAIDAALPLRATRELMIERGPLELLSVTPAERVITSGEPPVIEATFSFPLAPPPATEVTVATSAGAVIPSNVTLLPGGQTLRISLDAPLDLFGSAAVRVVASALRGIGGRFDLGTWSTPTLALALDAPVDDLATNATVAIAVRGDGTALSAPLEVWAGSVRVASFDAPPWQFSWDTRGVAEGSYPLSLRVRGWYVPGHFPTVTVDRTAPSATCSPKSSAPGDLWVMECVRVAISEHLDAPPVLLANGVPRAVVVNATREANVLDLCPTDAPPPVPASVTVALPSDAAGNVPPSVACALPLPVWRAPVGAGPLAPTGTVIRTSDVAFSQTIPWGAWPINEPYDRMDVVWVSPERRLVAAHYAGYWSSPSYRWQVTDVSRLTYSDGTVVWAEDGLGVFRAEASDGEWTDPMPPSPADGTSPSLSQNGRLLAFSSPSASEGRILDVRFKPNVSPWWWTSAGRPATDPASVADVPSVSWNDPSAPLLAWLQAPATGARAELRAALGDLTSGTWSSVGGSLSVDPTLSSSEPAAYAVGTERAVAWVEGGLVLVRRWDGSAFGAPEVLTSLGATGRMPRFIAGSSDLPVLVFVETDDAGDHVRARRFDGAGWAELPGPFGESSGAVVQLVASERGGVAWVDGAGEVRLRLYNR